MLLPESLCSEHPCLLFDADGTEINRKGRPPEKVVGDGLNESHTSLFLIVSATGEVLDPIVCHDNSTFYRNTFVPDQKRVYGKGM